MRRFFAAGVLVTVALFLRAASAGDSDAKAAKEALQALNDYIGGWKGSGSVETDRLATWKEQADWSWRFKGDDAWLTLKIDQGKYFKEGEMRYLTDKEVYQLTLLDKQGKKMVFQGKVKSGGKLTLERKDPDTKETQQLQMNLAGGGIRFVYTYNVKPANRTLFNKEFQVAFTKEGESFGAAAKKVECIVTGGLGTMPVSYGGMTYYVCCSGCRDAFNENPAKFVKEYEARKRSGK